VLHERYAVEDTIEISQFGRWEQRASVPTERGDEPLKLCVGAFRKRVLAALRVDDIMAG
jgi:hypothetical protein